jgi:hypothetical protein
VELPRPEQNLKSRRIRVDFRLNEDDSAGISIAAIRIVDLILVNDQYEDMARCKHSFRSFGFSLGPSGATGFFSLLH